MDINLVLVVGVYLFINIVAFLVMMIDKIKSRKAKVERISEGTLFFMAAAFGSVGVYFGMFVFHHKTRKWHFIIGVPLLMLQNIVFLSVVYNFLNSLM
jgi:uncharacterized membrane protein YsdA (DUF1294 family)